MSNDTRVYRHGIKESLRKGKKIELKNVPQLTAKAVTPNKSEKKMSSLRERLENKRRTIDASAKIPAEFPVKK